MVPFGRLLDALSEIPDPRRAQGQRYPLPHLLLFIVLAIMSGATSYRAMRTFIRERNATLAALYGVGLRAVPALNTVRDLLHRLDADDLEAVFRHHAEGLVTAAASDDAAPASRCRPVIALDGKALRQSFDRVSDRKAAHVLSAFASESALILAHMDVDDKSNEIPAVEAMIRSLGLSGVIFTVDAMHCQKKHSRPRPTPAMP
jgi:hypothetical protein